LRYRSFVEEEFVREIESPFEAIRWQRERGKEGKRERGKEGKRERGKEGKRGSVLFSFPFRQRW